MVIDPQEIESVSPKQEHRDRSSDGKVSVMEFIQNMTIGSPTKGKDTGKVCFDMLELLTIDSLIGTLFNSHSIYKRMRMTPDNTNKFRRSLRVRVNENRIYYISANTFSNVILRHLQGHFIGIRKFTFAKPGYYIEICWPIEVSPGCYYLFIWSIFRMKNGQTGISMYIYILSSYTTHLNNIYCCFSHLKSVFINKCFISQYIV